MFAFREKWNMGTGERGGDRGGYVSAKRERVCVSVCMCVGSVAFLKSISRLLCVCLSVQWKPPASLFLFGRFNKPSIKTEFYFNYCLISLASTHSTVTQRIFWCDLPRMLLIRSCYIIYHTSGNQKHLNAAHRGKKTNILSFKNHEVVYPMTKLCI